MDRAITRSYRTTKKATTGLSARPILTAMSPRANPALDELTPDSDPGPLPWQPLVNYALDAAAGVMLSSVIKLSSLHPDVSGPLGQTSLKSFEFSQRRNLLLAAVYPLMMESLMLI